jgi:DNA ligase (NAD+)
MNRDQADKNIRLLRSEIAIHDRLYYVDAKPEVSDREYDLMMSDLRGLEAKFPDLVDETSPTQRVSGQPVDGFKTVAHDVPMLSVDNTYDADAVEAFDVRVRSLIGDKPFTYVADEKVDGCAISLIYKDGVLVRAVTRGDGKKGDEVTGNVRAIKSVPLVLERSCTADIPTHLEVRGEVHWPTADFEAHNARLSAAGKDLVANARNGAAGTLKQRDSKVVAERKLAFIAHGFGKIIIGGCVASDGLIDGMKTYTEVVRRFKRWGLPVSRYMVRCPNIQVVLKYIDRMDTARKAIPYATDGVVIKVDQLQLRSQVGETNKYPRWCVAFKFAAEKVQSELLGVTYQVGKRGTVTPVAELTPVQLAGTTVKRASLHNFDQVARLDIHVGDTVLVEKAGEIIPQVVKVVKAGPRTQGAIVAPSKCPECGASVEKDPGGVYIRCISPACKAQVIERVKYFCGRRQMDIDGIGDSLVRILVENGWVKYISDLYLLQAHESEIVNIKGVGTKGLTKIIDNLEASKDRGMAALLVSLNIQHCGHTASDAFADAFGSIDKLASSSIAEMEAIDGIGSTIAQSVYDWFRSDFGTIMIQKLKDLGLKMDSVVTLTKVPQVLAGKTIVATGTLEHFGRKEVQDVIKKYGGKSASSVSKNTDFLVAGDGAGSKLAKAQKLGVEVIDEEEFMKRIGKTVG